jgi:EAL domain-containing protein (putative c-di-GMP-specific phosphodiesterase class I)
MSRIFAGQFSATSWNSISSPLVAVGDRSIVGVEALLRWHHPNDGEITPATFIPIAEQSGSILPIGEWVLRQACLAALEWQDIQLSVNISPVQFRQPCFVDMVAATLAQTGFQPERLELEITEGVLLLDTEGALTTFNRLKALGIRMSMDDFGTGYSSLSYLQRFAFDKIKIDQSFVRDVDVNPDAASIVDMSIALAKRLGIETNAEGVETAAQFDILRAGGCDQVQGYLFCRAVPAAEFALRLAAQQFEEVSHGDEARQPA